MKLKLNIIIIQNKLGLKCHTRIGVGVGSELCRGWIGVGSGLGQGWVRVELG